MSTYSLAIKEQRLKIGIAGTDGMGAAIASRLLNLGHEVTVWSRTAEKTQALALCRPLGLDPAQLLNRLIT